MFQYPLETSIREILPFGVFALFGVVFIIQMIYYWVIYARLAFYKDKSPSVSGEMPVSVVICARNEYQNLISNLPLILEQDYPEYEVVVVNDSSDDDSLELLNAYAKEYQHLKIFDLERNLNFFSGKKFPLSLGIKSARYDIILLTDADCKPAGKDWIRNMQSHCDDSTEIILGYGAFQKTLSFLNKFIRYDSFQAALQYLSYSLAGMPYMGVGRNLSYRKQLFFKAGGFISHYQIQSGDDDLFINSVATKKNTRIEIQPGSHTISWAKTLFSQWIFQKRRHYTSARYYRPKFKFLLGLAYISKLLLYALFVVLIILRYNLIITAAAFSVFYISHLLIISRSADKLNERDLIFLSPLLDVLLLVVIPFIYISNLFYKSDRWK